MFVFDNICLENSNEKVILGITTDNKLTIWKIHVEKLVKNFAHYLEYLIIWKQTKKTYFQWDDKISIQLLSSDLDAPFKKVKQFNQQITWRVS